MNKYLFLIFLPYLVYSQTVTNVRVRDHNVYFAEVAQELVYELERREWCNLKLPNITNDINLTIYGWENVGQVNYTNGFVTSIGMISLPEANIQQLWTSSATASQVLIRGNMLFHEVGAGFDVDAVINEERHFYTGVFTWERIEFQHSIVMNLLTHEISTTSTLTGLLAGGTARRMNYRPENNVTQVLSRVFLAADAWTGVGVWASQIFQPILHDLATTKIQFPEICYNCAT